jgi:hypothetical protein
MEASDVVIRLAAGVVALWLLLKAAAWIGVHCRRRYGKPKYEQANDELTEGEQNGRA